MNKKVYTCVILIGIPNAGKDYYIRKQQRFGKCLNVISCDRLRELANGSGKYVFNPKTEEYIWETFYDMLGKANYDIVINNTNCKLTYINKIKQSLNKDVEWKFKYIWFDVPLWKAHIRNIKRRIFENKWIPVKVLNQFYKNYQKLKNDRHLFM